MYRGLGQPVFTIKDVYGNTVETITIPIRYIEERKDALQRDDFDDENPFDFSLYTEHNGYLFGEELTVIDRPNHGEWILFAVDQLSPSTESQVNKCLRLEDISRSDYEIFYKPHQDAANEYRVYIEIIDYQEIDMLNSDRITIGIRGVEPVDKHWLDYDLAPPTVKGDFNDDYNDDFDNVGS